MNSLIVAMLTVLPVSIGYRVGSGIGFGRICRWIGPHVVGSACGIATCVLGYRREWFYPCGLITPIVAGLVVALASLRLVRVRTIGRKIGRKMAVRGSRLSSLYQGLLGGVVGATAGLMVAVVVWESILFVNRPTAHAEFAHTAPEPAMVSDENSLQRLATIAHAGLIQHLPVAGPLTEDFLAVGEILDTPLDVRQEFAVSKGWDRLAELPSFIAIVENDSLMAEIESASAGSLLALYRLQKHPLLIEFSQEEPLRTLIGSFDAQQIAAELSRNASAREAGTDPPSL